MANAVTITTRNAFEIINMNKRGEKPESLTDTSNMTHKSVDLVEQESLTRFDKRKSNNNRKKKKKTPAPENNARETKQPNNTKPRNKQPNRKPNKNNANEKAQTNQQENK